MIDYVEGLSLDYDLTQHPQRDYETHPNRVWQKIRRWDEPYPYKSGVDVNWPM